MVTLISSQEYINDDIVAAKIDAHDFTVYLSPVFIIDGEEYQVIMDGHHSYHAAIESGNEIDFIIQDSCDNDRIALIDDVNLFLEACYMDTDWYDIKTGRGAF